MSRIKNQVSRIENKQREIGKADYQLRYETGVQGTEYKYSCDVNATRLMAVMGGER